jgi:hypothetical protein
VQAISGRCPECGERFVAEVDVESAFSVAELVYACSNTCEEFAAAIADMPAESARVDLQEVTGGAFGIRVSASSRQRAFVAYQTVSGPASMGIIWE